MLRILTQTGRLVAARWPWLLAWYLAGWLGRFLALQLAGTVGAFSAIGGMSLLPLAVLARLLSFIAMFLVLRDAMPAYQLAVRSGLDVDAAVLGPAKKKTGKPKEVVDLTLALILPFFAFYAAYQFLGEDVQAYAQISLENTNFFDDDRPTDTGIDIGLNVLTVSVVVVAFVGRYLLKRFRPKLPSWTSIVSVYLEALWVFLAAIVIGDVLAAITGWVESRQAIVWLEDLRAWLGEQLLPAAWLWDAVSWVVGEAGDLVLLPIAWLALAAVVFGRALAGDAAAERRRLSRLERARERLDRLPARLGRRVKDVGLELTSRWRPLASAFSLIWRAGAPGMGLFVLAYAVLTAADFWLAWWAMDVIGPHEFVFWRASDSLLAFVVGAVLEPVRIALIVAAYDYCLRRLEERRGVAGATAALTEAAVQAD